MRLLLDEMISPKIARELSALGHDVQAITGDRPELKATPDIALVRRMQAEGRSIVTNDVRDFQPIHHQLIARGEEHSGMVFTWDASLPRSKAGIPVWIAALDQLLKTHPSDDAFKNRAEPLP